MIRQQTRCLATCLQLFARCLSRLSLCCLAVILLTLPAITAAGELRPLLQNIQQLHCATDASQANDALHRLKLNIDPVTGLPDEWEGSTKFAQLHAGTLDLAISTIIKQIANFPGTTSLAESVVLQWNYCQVFHNEQQFDLQQTSNGLKRSRSNYQSPAAWDGFAMLGLGSTDAPRYIPQAFSNTATTARDHLLYNWWDLQRNQCLPHPANGQLFHRQQYIARARVNIDQRQPTDHYPPGWNDSCPAIEKKTNTDQLKLAAITQHMLHKAASPMFVPDIPSTKKPKPAIEDTIPEPRKPTLIAKSALPKAIPPRQKLAPVLTAAEEARNNAELQKRIEEYRRQLGLAQTPAPQPVLAAALAPEDHALPMYLFNPVTAAPNQPLDDEREFHAVNGSFALSNRSFAPDDWSITANFTYKPVAEGFYFARGGFTLTENEEPLSYFWGLGYNNWRTNTWAFEINNWGPLKPGDGLAIEKAIASLSYKFNSPLLDRFNLSTSMSLSGGKENSPVLTVASSWSPKPNWFIRNLLTQPLEGGDIKWAYGFGYNNWRSNTWALEYNNWGQNSLSSPQFRKNALLTLSWKWNL